MVLFLDPQGKYSINCSSLWCRTKLHFIRHCSVKPFFPSPFPPPSWHAQEASQFNSSCSSWCHPSPCWLEALCLQPIQLAFQAHPGLTYFSHHLNSYSPTSSSNQLCWYFWRSRGFSCFHLMPESPPLYLHRKPDLLLYLLPHYYPIHSWSFPYNPSIRFLFPSHWETAFHHFLSYTFHLQLVY